MGLVSLLFAVIVSDLRAQAQEREIAGRPGYPLSGSGPAAIDVEAPRTCGELLMGVYRERIFGGHSYDKWKHCYASCLIARECDPMVAAALGIFKECMDFVGTVAYRVTMRLHAPSIVIRLAARLRGDPEVMDLVADAQGIASGFSGSSCSTCCDRIYP